MSCPWAFIARALPFLAPALPAIGLVARKHPRRAAAAGATLVAGVGYAAYAQATGLFGSTETTKTETNPGGDEELEARSFDDGARKDQAL